MVQKSHIYDQLLDFPKLLLFFLLSVSVCHILLFVCSIFFNTIRVSNSLDPDQARHFVGPDLGLNFAKVSVNIHVYGIPQFYMSDLHAP